METTTYQRGRAISKVFKSKRKIIFKAISRFSISGKIALTIIGLIVLLALFSGVLTVHPYDIPSADSLEAPSSQHWLGTDDLGMDIWAQICYGARVSIAIGLSTALLSSFGGSILGIISGYFGGKIDKLVMRITDIMIALPNLPLIIVIGAFFGTSIRNIILVLVLFSWMRLARIVRSKVLSVKEENYVIAASSYGANLWHLTKNHFLPAVLPLVMVSTVRMVSRAIVAEASLAFLGLGDPTSKSWGLILNRAMNFQGIYFTDYWKWWVVSPLLLIAILVISIAFLSRDLEKILDTKKQYTQ